MSPNILGDNYPNTRGDADILFTKEEIYIYIKFPGFIFWINILLPNAKVFNGIQILDKGIISPIKAVIDIRFLDYIKSRLLIFKNTEELISEKQHKIISESFYKDKDKLNKSKTLEAILRDIELNSHKNR